MKVQDPNGQTWRITRRWVPWRRRFKRISGGDWQASDLKIHEIADAIRAGNLPPQVVAD